VTCRAAKDPSACAKARQGLWQYVRITRGVLSYDDTARGTTLDLVAEREIKDEDITVAVNVRGRLDSPFITMTSQPAMSSNEALSYLLTGRSINTLQSGEVASVDRAGREACLAFRVLHDICRRR
jgi:translocation and assembly module TamB